MSKMREEFEAWISHYIGESWLKPDPARSGEYFDNGTQSMWESWQASRAALCIELPEPECGGDGYYYEDGLARGHNELLSAVVEKLNQAGVTHK